jgi:hypothetical protein
VQRIDEVLEKGHAVAEGNGRDNQVVLIKPRPIRGPRQVGWGRTRREYSCPSSPAMSFPQPEGAEGG